MKAFRWFFFLLSLVVGFHPALSAQTKSSFDPLKDNISQKIPPLTVLIDSALANDPYIKFRDLQITVNSCKLKASQVEWSRNIGVQSDLRYGNFYDYSSNSTAIAPSVSSNRFETKYGSAVFLNMPLYTILNRKNQRKLAEAEIEQAQQMSEVQRKELRQTVIRQYNDLILKQSLVKMKSKFLETTRINMQMVEKEFLNGVIPITEYSRQAEASSRTESDFETARMDFLTAYLILEEIVGMDFHLTNVKPSNEGN